jgi:O-antigen ligase
VRFSRSSAAFAGLGVVCLLSSVTAAEPILSLQASVRVVGSAVMLIVLEETFRDAPWRLRSLLVAFFASLVVPAVFAILQLVGSAPVEPLYGPAIDVGRIQGTFVHPNAFATYLVVVIPLALALLRHVGTRVRVALVGCAAVAGVLLLFTYARAAWIAGLLAVLVVGWKQDKRIIAVLLGGVLLLTVAVPSVSTRLGELGQSRDELTEDPNSLVWRIEYWGRILPSISESPVTGIGLGMVERDQAEGLPPHNVFVQAAAETGLAGVTALVLLVAALFGDLRRALASARPGLHRAVVVAAVAAASGFLLQTFSENLLNQPVSHWYLLLPVAWATSHSGRRPWVLGMPTDGSTGTAGDEGAAPRSGDHVR